MDHQNTNQNGEGSSAQPPPFTDELSRREALMLQHISSLMQTGFAQQRIETDRIINERLASGTPPSGNRSNEGHRPSGESLIPDKSDKVSFKSFKTSGATEFDGVIDPIKAYEWIKNTEKIFRISHCKNDDKVSYGTAMLIGPAIDWWEGIYDSLTETQQQTISWESFKEKFLRQYCPGDLQDRYAREFLDLKQGKSSVIEYLAEFHKKARFASEYVSTEEKKVKKFVEGLRIEIREILDCQKLQTLEEAAEQARKREHILAIKNVELMPPPKQPRVESSSHSFSSHPTDSRESFSRPSFSNRPSTVRI